MNGVYLRALAPDEFAERLVAYTREQGLNWDEQLVRGAAPLVQEKIAKLGEFPAFAGFFFEDFQPDPALLDGSAPLLAEAEEALENVEPFTAQAIEDVLRRLAEKRDLKPRTAFQPIRVAVTGSRVSPGLFESLELLGREKSVERIRNARAAAA
jgi:glutamyl-tRNA synthetase